MKRKDQFSLFIRLIFFLLTSLLGLEIQDYWGSWPYFLKGKVFEEGALERLNSDITQRENG